MSRNKARGRSARRHRRLLVLAAENALAMALTFNCGQALAINSGTVYGTNGADGPNGTVTQVVNPDGTISIIVTPGGDGGAGGNASNSAIAKDTSNFAEAVGGNGGKGGNGTSGGAPIHTTAGGNGGAGGSATAVSQQFGFTDTSQTKIFDTAIATGGNGGAGGTGGSARFVPQGAGGMGGPGAAAYTVSSASASIDLDLMEAEAVSTGGNGADGGAASGAGGAGGAASVSTSTYDSADADFEVNHAFAIGGNGGHGIGSGEGGNGADETLGSSAVSANAVINDSLTLAAVGGNSGGSNGGNPGLAGMATSSLTLSGDKDGIITDLIAAGGNGGDCQNTNGSNGGDATALANITNTGDASATAVANGGLTIRLDTDASFNETLANDSRGSNITSGTGNAGSGGNTIATAIAQTSGTKGNFAYGPGNNANATATGGNGGDVINSAVGNGGNGGTATASAEMQGGGTVYAETSNTTAHAIGGNGGQGAGAGNAGGNGGGASLATVSDKNSVFADVAATAWVTGGNGGAGINGAEGGAGASESIINPMTISTGGDVTLTQEGDGGSGGSSTGGTGGTGGDGSSSLSLNQGADVTLPSLSVSNYAVSGNGGDGTIAGDGGYATSSVNVSGAGEVDAVAGANSGSIGIVLTAGNGGSINGGAGGTGGAGGAANASCIAGSSGSLSNATAEAAGGNGGGLDGGAVGSGGAGGAALASATSTSVAGATATATAIGGASGAGNGSSFSSGAGGDASASADATSNSSGAYSALASAEAAAGAPAAATNGAAAGVSGHASASAASHWSGKIKAVGASVISPAGAVSHAFAESMINVASTPAFSDLATYQCPASAIVAPMPDATTRWAGMNNVQTALNNDSTNVDAAMVTDLQSPSAVAGTSEADYSTTFEFDRTAATVSANGLVLGFLPAQLAGLGLQAGDSLRLRIQRNDAILYDQTFTSDESILSELQNSVLQLGPENANLAGSDLNLKVLLDLTQRNASSGADLQLLVGHLATAQDIPGGTWASSTGGSWALPTDWSANTMPIGPGTTATFGSAITAPRTVTLDENTTVGSINFNNASAYTIASGVGGNSLILDNAGGQASITSTVGDHTISAPVVITSPGVAINTTTGQSLALTGGIAGAGTVNKTGDGLALVGPMTVNGLNVQAGRSQFTPSPSAPARSVGALSVASGAILDIADGKLITTNPAGTWNGSSYTGVAGLVESGKAGATGILSSAIADGDKLHAIGVAKVGDIDQIADSATGMFAGQTVHGSDTIVMFTYGGDANLDGKINIDDYGRIDGNVGQSGSVFGWYNGDFNYDGKINIDDYGIIDGNIGQQGAPIPTIAAGDSFAALSNGVSAVPEPASLGLITLVGAGLLRRRRRRFTSEQRK